MRILNFFNKILIFLLIIFLFSPKNIFAVYNISVNNLPQSINANNQQDFGFEVNVILGGNTEYYLRAAFFNPSNPSAYFGYTDGYNGTEAKSFYKITTNDNGEWGGILKIKPDINSPYFKGEGIYNFKIGYYTAGGSSSTWKYENTIFLAYSLPSSTPVQSSPTPIPTLTIKIITPTLTPTLKPPMPTSASTTTYKINEVKDEDGEILSSVKVYVDNIYLHHYVPEVITFCKDCQCGGYVDCGFGQHTIKLEKTGYNDWQETKTINDNDFFEVNPVMVFSQTDEPTPTPTKITSPTSTPTLKINPTPTSKEIIKIATESGEILGADSEATPAFYPLLATQDGEIASLSANNFKKSNFWPKLIFVLTLIFLFFVSLWVWYNFKCAS